MVQTDWFNACGVAAYRFGDNGSIEIQNQGFPAYDVSGAQAKGLIKIWMQWSEAITAASQAKGVPSAWIASIMYNESQGNPKSFAPCEPVNCPALWNRGQCASQGGPEIYCAGGIMAFTSGTSAGYGKTIPYYMAHPEEQIMDAADLIAKLIAKSKGDVCAAAKKYNGGSVCAGGGIVGMGGQGPGGGYVERFIRTTNTFVALGLSPGPSSSAGLQGALAMAAFGALGFLAYRYFDAYHGWTKTLAGLVG
jgi:Transglycosylase SLT domain